nr:hypothetical protein [uncultured Chryseobacterium sp.]
MKNIIFMTIILIVFSCKKEKETDLNWILLNDKNKIPGQIRDFFQAAENSKLFLANPDEEFNITDIILNPGLPSRQLKLLERKNHLWRMVFIQGDIGKSYQFYQFSIRGDTVSEIKKGYSIIILKPAIP